MSLNINSSLQNKTDQFVKVFFFGGGGDHWLKAKAQELEVDMHSMPYLLHSYSSNEVEINIIPLEHCKIS